MPTAPRPFISNGTSKWKLYVWHCPDENPTIATFCMSEANGQTVVMFSEAGSTLQQVAEAVKRHMEERAKQGVQLELTFAKNPGTPSLLPGGPPSSKDQEFIRRIVESV